MRAQRLERPALPGGALLLLAPIFTFVPLACGSSSDSDGDTAGDSVTAEAGDEWSGVPDPTIIGGPDRAAPDVFHPDNQPDDAGVRPGVPDARKGGRVIIHMLGLPRHANYMTENSAWTRRWLRECHEFLVRRDWNSWDHMGELAANIEVEDAVVLAGNGGERLFGRVSEDGDEVVVEPVSAPNPLTGERRLSWDEVASIQRGTVFTMDLREDVTWHDGKPFDAHDVYFSWQCYWNSKVDCEANRDKIQKITRAEVLGDHRIRFFFEKQYFLALDTFTTLTILPSHVFNLADPENPDYKAGIDVLGDEQGTFVNDHPANKMWVGLGAYKITAFEEQYVEAERYAGYHDPERAGHVDKIRWRYIANDDAAKEALINGELDVFARLRSEDYFGEFCQREEFVESFYAAYIYLPRMQLINWNTKRPVFKDPEVRRALAHSFDWDLFLETVANGLGVRVTGPEFYLNPYYDHSVKPIPFDLDKAAEILDDAGWYDRDGDGIRDKDGVALQFEYLMTPGNKATEMIVLPLQENLGKIGVKLNIATRDWAAMIERAQQKDFDAFSIAWILDPENDPYQLWHSWEGPPGEDRSNNYAGLEDPEVDRLIEAIQVELDDERRIDLFRQFHRRLYELQPVMYQYLVPSKFVVAKRIRNFWSYGMDPGYSVRDWFIVEEDQPGR